MIFATILIASLGAVSSSYAPIALRPRIIGGAPAAIETYPYQAALLWNGQLVCGGTLIEASTVLTAAHCVALVPRFPFSSSSQGWSVRAGSASRSATDPSVQVRQASRIIVHTKYNKVTNANDIAIVKLVQPFTLSSSVGVALLPGAGTPDPVPGSNATATGWGATSEGGGRSDRLRAVTLPIVAQAVCRRAYGSRLLSSMLCVGAPGKSTCLGDSGGPLAVVTENTATVLGITSSGLGCGRKGYPAVHTKVSAFRAWILTNGGV